MEATDQQTHNLVIFMPPPPIIHWQTHTSVNQDFNPPVASSPPHRPSVPATTCTSPASSDGERRVAPPQTKDAYVEYTQDFVTKNIENFSQVTDKSVKSIAEKAATQADIIAAELGLRTEIIPGLVKLAFYDFVILCDDSSSMTFDEQHIPALRDTLRRVAYFATRLQPKGIAIRFLNHHEGIGKSFDDLTDAHDVDMKVASVPFQGNTRLGEVLDAKIVQPMILKKVQSGKLERPVFVVIITDGQPTNEHPGSLRNTIRNCKEVLSHQSYNNAAAIFLISQIGNDKGATLFLKSLETDQQISSMVFCSTDDLSAKLARLQSTQQDKKYTAWLIELFLAALDKQTKHAYT
ncbi:hypothetical protein JMJ35_000296 [Cladonia borealis]|uniref:VWFA domain-containing protein n=1 Tax=Cladonia borealis TaxID=184061 RepID=A0AA39RAD6_9LECA|nr:hypothetical protein JMJ35_000296 [Cladonia borealis]